MDELNDILSGEEEAAPAIEQGTSEQPSDDGNVTVPANRDEQGRFAPKGDEQDAPPASKEETGLQAGIAAERKKRQEAEQRYADLERQIAELREASKPKEPEAPPPSIWDDEQATFNHYGQQFMGTAVEQAAMQSRLQTSELLMLQNVDDFAAKKQEIFEFVGSNPAINQEVANSPHPWKTAYEAFNNSAFAKELGATNMDDLKAKLLEQIKAEQAAERPQLPQSLANAAGRTGAAAPQANGDGIPSLHDILDG